ncbi:hypothetical protein [Gluconobacter morbifer]|uniref:hypothetical protein n=1 Tax=Gluconobacter morbifer TaxID=479935 RepID=UPI001111C09C|nr:hypothetical protein [Gluconobacter morbifer]
MSLHILGVLQPGEGDPSQANVVIRAEQVNIPLFAGQDREMHLPLIDALWTKNPPLCGTVPKGGKAVLEVALKVATPDPVRFTKADAQRWLRQMNACIRDLTGVMIAFFSPMLTDSRLSSRPGHLSWRIPLRGPDV